jgi:hypothetical protein
MEPLKQRAREQLLSTKLASVILTNKLKEEVKEKVNQQGQRINFNELDFQKIFESQFDNLLISSTPKPNVEINSLKGLQKIRDLRIQHMATLDATAVGIKGQKTIESQAIRNLVKNRGGANQKVDVKSLLGKLYTSFVSGSTTFLVKIQTHRREIVIFAGICIAIYGIISLLRSNFDIYNPPKLVDQPLSAEEFTALCTYVLKTLITVTDLYLEATGTKVRSCPNGFANAQPNWQVQEEGGGTLGKIQEIAKIVTSLKEMICSDPLLKQIVHKVTNERYVLNSNCTITDGFMNALHLIQEHMRILLINNPGANETQIREEMGIGFYSCLSYQYHRILCAHVKTDAEFAAHYCSSIFSDLIQPSKRKFIFNIGSRLHSIISGVLGSVITAFLMRVGARPRNPF